MAASSYAHHVRTLGWNGPSSCIPNNGLPIRAGGTVSTWPISCAGHHDSPSLAGGLCTMDADGIHCQQLRATGRVPDINAAGIVLFHSDAYRIIRRELGGAEHDLGDGAFAVWTVDGAIVYQGLGGRLFRMAADGRAREPLEPAGRVPDVDDGGAIVVHTDAYVVSLRTASGVTRRRGRRGAAASGRGTPSSTTP